MVDQSSTILISDEVIFSKIFLIRNKQVILDKDLAVFYQVETKQLKRAVRRNSDRFPEDFMFELTQEEYQYLRSQFGTSSWGGSRYAPMAFTEHGIVMLASVLHSSRAINVNIQIVRAFLRMREILNSQNMILSRLQKVETGQIQQGESISVIFKLLEEMDKENRILSKDWNRYHVCDVVFKPKNFTPEELYNGYWKAFQEFFSLKNIAKRLFYNVPITSQPVDAFLRSLYYQLYYRKKVNSYEHPLSGGIHRIS